MNQDKLKNLITDIPFQLSTWKVMKLNLSYNRCASTWLSKLCRTKWTHILTLIDMSVTVGTNKKTLKTEKGRLSFLFPEIATVSSSYELSPRDKCERKCSISKSPFTAKGWVLAKLGRPLKNFLALMVATLISNMIGRVINEVVLRQNRPLGAVYPIVYINCIVVKVRNMQCVIN